MLRVCVYPRERDFENFDEGGEADARPSSSQIQARRAACRCGLVCFVRCLSEDKEQPAGTCAAAVFLAGLAPPRVAGRDAVPWLAPQPHDHVVAQAPRHNHTDPHPHTKWPASRRCRSCSRACLGGPLGAAPCPARVPPPMPPPNSTSPPQVGGCAAWLTTFLSLFRCWVQASARGRQPLLARPRSRGEGHWERQARESPHNLRLAPSFVAAKMAAKYGDYAQDSEFQQKKGWFGRK